MKDTTIIINEILESIERFKSKTSKHYSLILKSQSKRKNVTLIYRMTNSRKNIFDWNHIDQTLSKDQIDDLKGLYKNYHRLFKWYQWKYKKLKHLKLSLEMTSIGLSRWIYCRRYYFEPNNNRLCRWPRCDHSRVFNKNRSRQ